MLFRSIIRDLRRGEFDVLVGINLLREGLDIPEVSLVAILDADKEGFLRSQVSLIQTIGRAARNVNGRVLMYADTVTDSMQLALDETSRRRELQETWNRDHGITPQGVHKAILDLSQGISPLASIIAALFLLGVQGIYNLATGSWMQANDSYGVTDMLMSMFGYAANRISPIVGGLALSAAILNHVRHRPWGALVASGLGFLSVTGIWALVTQFAGVTI